MPSLTSRRTARGARALVAAGNMFARWKFQAALIAIIAVFAILAAGQTASAQTVPVDESLPPIADLSLVADHAARSIPRWRLTVRNNTIGHHPGVRASIVKVRITVYDQISSARPSVTGNIKSTRIWTIRDLSPNRSTRTVIEPPVPPSGDDGLYPFYLHAEIIETDPMEPPGYQHNNETEHWSVRFIKGNNSDRERFTHGDFKAGVQISDLAPSVGANTTFTVNAANFSGGRYSNTAGGTYEDTLSDVRVKISLSPGLTLASTPQAPTGTSYDPTSGIWNVGVLEINVSESKSLPVEVTLTDDDLPLQERCLTVELIHAVPWFAFLPNKRSDDTARVCLEARPVLVSGGSFSLFHYDNCLGDTDYPCADEDTLELVARINRVDIDLPNWVRTDKFTTGTRGATYFQPEEIVVHIQDLQGRDAGKWSTDDAFDLKIGQREFDATWSGFKESVTVQGVDGAAFPGRWRMVTPDGSFEYLDVTDGTKVEGSSYSFSEIPSNGLQVLKIEFDTLGTYVALFEIEATKSGTKYADSGTYTFHVGPVADLEVRDAGASPEVFAGQSAYTIMALNNGPNIPPNARVTLTGVPEDAETLVREGTYAQGSCENDLCQGVWTLGELSALDARRASGLSDGPVLTLIVDDASPAPITVAIANTENYSVCIDSSGDDVDAATEAACTATSGNAWHSTGYYDYIPANNTATIAARAGSGGEDPDSPGSVRTMGTPIGNVLVWEPVEEVNRFAVTHYEVERWASQWTPLAGRVQGTLHFDMAGRSSADYRVRAVNIFGVPGPWSITGRPPDAPGDFTVELSDRGPVLSWTEPTSPTPVTGYVIDISDTPEGDNRTNDVTVAANVTTWTHTGLSGGDVKFYRVQARNRDGVGPWTEWQSVSTGPGAPGSLRARANGPSEIVLTWSEASSRDVTIYEYELEYSDTSASEGYEWTFLQTVLHDEGLRYVDNTVPHGTTRYYRVRGRTLQGNVGGAWSNVASATTSAAGPSPPLNVSADYAVGNTENAALLTWDAPASGDASYYRIEHSTDGGATWESESNRHTGTCDVGGTTKFCYTDSGLFSGTEHWYRVAGVNRSGVPGEWSAPVSHITQGEPTDPPGEPQNLRITSVSGRQVSLAWEAPEDDGGTRVTGYEYMVEGPCVHAPEEICQVVKPTRTGGTSRTVTVPNFRGRYEFYVRALNAVGAGWWSQPVGQYINPQRNWRVSLSPSRLTVTEGGEATYTVRLTSDPGQPVWVALDWYGDESLGEGHPDRGIPSLSEQQFKWLLPSNYASRNPDIYLDPDYTAPWNTGVTITVTAAEDNDSENGTLEIHNTVFYIPCADLGNPAGCEDDPEDTGVTAYLTVTERDDD